LRLRVQGSGFRDSLPGTHASKKEFSEKDVVPKQTASFGYSSLQSKESFAA
jgi:hypothetical protein